MNLRDFIFSNATVPRVSRHASFWVARLVLYLLRQCGIFYMKAVGGSDYDFLLKFYPLMVHVSIDMAYCYGVVYWLVPKYLSTKRYASFAVLLAALTISSSILKAAYDLWLLYGWQTPPSVDNFLWWALLDNINNGSPVICALFVSIKMLKSWYNKEDEKLVLAEENVQAELQLLKAQVHPHFLFNTLNNIYSFTLTRSPQAPGLVLKLSDTLRYMITDCDDTMVPLEKELKMINDYIGLEKVRYGNRLQLEVEINGDAHNKMIAPLLLIPFVENSFKHGTSQVLHQPWIHLRIDIERHRLLFTLGNSKPLQQNVSNGKNGIGLKNVQKRLHLLYPRQHRLQIESTEEIFNVSMELPLQENETAIVSPRQNLAHVYG